ncbi:MAG: ATP-binding protein [Deltaproteobacteria bacterium]|nr:ATP-binding protein [Deltaproteobacteria bacterium]
MYARLFKGPTRQSFFLFGPRGTGKTAWVRARLPGAITFDLLDARLYARLTATPSLVGELVPAAHRDWVVIDEVQRAPALLDEVHRLIESRGLRFVLTGSSARKLRQGGVNLLAGRALTRHLHPLTAAELGTDFDLRRAARIGGLPFAWTAETPGDYLASYASTYLREEVLQEGLTRNLGAFSRFLEAASFSQAAVLNMASVARESGIAAKVAESYFAILEDLLLAIRLPAFTRRAKRRVVQHPKFFFFDAGVFRAIRPRGPLDSPEEADGPALETLVLQHLRAWNDYRSLGCSLHYWRTPDGDEVDFILYGEPGLWAIEVKRSSRIRREDLKGLARFLKDYPRARALLLHPGTRRWHESGVDIVPLSEALVDLDGTLGVG